MASIPNRESITKSNVVYAKIVSKTPGRLRLRLDKEFRNYQEIDRLSSMLKECIDINKLRTSIQTGSITIFYSKDHNSFKEIDTFLSEVGVILTETISDQLNREKSVISQQIIHTLSDWNQGVKTATNNRVDLRLIIPISFGMLAIRQLLIKGVMLETIPWYVLAWYAFDSFIKLEYGLQD